MSAPSPDPSDSPESALWHHMAQDHDLILTLSEFQEIVRLAHRCAPPPLSLRLSEQVDTPNTDDDAGKVQGHTP